MGIPENFVSHLKGGTTTVCRCWRLSRRDGVEYGFTDHDRGLSFAGIEFRADTGLTALALQQATGLSIDNTDAIGALSASVVKEVDITSGLFDGAIVEAWLVNWANPLERSLQFKGSIGEVQSGGGAFRAELRGLSEPLNVSRRRAYQKLCSQTLGDANCGIVTSDPEFSSEAKIASVKGASTYRLTEISSFPNGWFDRGKIEVKDGPASGLVGVIKLDQVIAGEREIVLWEEPRRDLQVGSTIKLTAGCDKRHATCQEKFANILNFGGFPHVPGEDWVMSYPARTMNNDGGSRN